jgi:uroporphyrinogen decarboxylase
MCLEIKKVIPLMIPRDRMLAALAFKPVDILPLEIHPSPAGIFEHGQKLIDLMRACGHDFSDLSELSIPEVLKEDFDEDGRYHKITTDEWGTTWEYRIYGVWGYRIRYPLADISRLATYRMPRVPLLSGEALEKAREAGNAHRQRFYLLGGGASLFETMQSLRPFDDVLVDIYNDTLEINRLVDLLLEYNGTIIQNALLTGVDAVAVGDDFGTQQGMMMSPVVWRRFFKKRYKALMEPAVKAGKQIFFHSCGQIWPILEDLREIGVNAIWPQLQVYDLPELAHRCRQLGLVVQLHPDRGDLMQRSTPQQVRDYILHLVDEFDCLSGGSWLYLEIDPGFPWENVKTLFETAMKLRSH